MCRKKFYFFGQKFAEIRTEYFIFVHEILLEREEEGFQDTSRSLAQLCQVASHFHPYPKNL